jgi:hypothetical protein
MDLHPLPRPGVQTCGSEHAARCLIPRVSFKHKQKSGEGRENPLGYNHVVTPDDDYYSWSLDIYFVKLLSFEVFHIQVAIVHMGVCRPKSHETRGDAQIGHVALPRPRALPVAVSARAAVLLPAARKNVHVSGFSDGQVVAAL